MMIDDDDDDDDDDADPDDDDGDGDGDGETRPVLHDASGHLPCAPLVANTRPVLIRSSHGGCPRWSSKLKHPLAVI